MKRFAATIIAALLLLSSVPATLVSLRPAAAGGNTQAQPGTASNCGLDAPAFCDSFDKPMGTGNRSGQLDGTVWGASRTTQDVNVGQGRLNTWTPASASTCSSAPLLPENDIQVCNGQLVEAVNDTGENVTILGMYPKQPFDIAGRIGKVTFDVNADSQGNHAVWPAFVYTDKPVPAPSNSALPAEDALAENSFGFTLAGVCDGANNAYCSNCSNQGEMTVDSAFITQHFAVTNLSVTQLGCVQQGSPSALNHFEVDISEGGATISGTEPGTQDPLIPLASIAVAMPLTRGLIWIEDVHYNACKFNSQCTHTFVWDNVGFDGPVLARDLSLDVLDNAARVSGGGQNLGWVNPTNLETVPKPASADLAASSAALLTLNWFPTSRDSFTYSVNGHANHQQSWPFPDQQSYAWRTISLPLPLSELQAGSNTVSVSTSDGAAIANIDIKLVGAGGIPCAPGSSQPCPSPTATPTATPTGTPSPQATGRQGAQNATRDRSSPGAKPRAGPLGLLVRFSSWWFGSVLRLQ